MNRKAGSKVEISDWADWTFEDVKAVHRCGGLGYVTRVDSGLRATCPACREVLRLDVEEGLEG